MFNRPRPEDYPEELSLANLEIHEAGIVLEEATQRYQRAIVGRLAVLAKLRSQS